MLGKRSTEPCRDFGGKRVKMGGKGREDPDEMEIRDFFVVFPVDASKNTLRRHRLTLLFENAGYMISGMKCPWFAVVEPESRTRRSVLEFVLTAQAMLIYLVVSLNIIRYLPPFDFPALRRIAYLFLQVIQARIRQGVECIASSAVADAVAKPTKHALDIYVRLTREEP